MPVSGASWVSLYPTSQSLAGLEPDFRAKTQAFLDALATAGASVKITATRRPRERAYLMHYAWCLWRGSGAVTPRTVPNFQPRAGESAIDIQWLHRTAAGAPDEHASLAAAHDMVRGYAISNLLVAPALASNHIAGKAIDTVISWTGPLSIKQKDGAIQVIDTAPRNHTNPDLIKVGKTYGVIHITNIRKDPWHWSFDGH